MKLPSAMQIRRHGTGNSLTTTSKQLRQITELSFSRHAGVLFAVLDSARWYCSDAAPSPAIDRKRTLRPFQIFRVAWPIPVGAMKETESRRLSHVPKDFSESTPDEPAASARHSAGGRAGH